MDAGTSQGETINLVLVCDDHYVILMAALIRSIEANLTTGTKLATWIVDDGITGENKSKLQSSIDTAITSVTWVDFATLTRQTPVPKDRSSYPLNIYARLFIPDFIPQHVEKVLYLDVDMIVLTDLGQLWDTDITGYFMAAVQDPRLLTFDNFWGGVKNFKELGFAGSTVYFNTGLLLINLKKWREHDIPTKVFDAINRNIKYANYPDQYGLNIVLADQWLQLDAGWNAFVDDPDTMPMIIHFVGRKPIYKAYKYSKEYRELFYKYLRQTAWKDAQPVREYARAVKKIQNIISKLKGDKQ